MNVFYSSLLGVVFYCAVVAAALWGPSARQASAILRRGGDEEGWAKMPAFSAVVAFADSFTDSGKSGTCFAVDLSEREDIFGQPLYRLLSANERITGNGSARITNGTWPHLPQYLWVSILTFVFSSN